MEYHPANNPKRPQHVTPEGFQEEEVANIHMIEEAPSYAKREREQERIAAQEAAAQQAAEDERARQLLGASRRERIVMLGLQGLRGGKR